MIKYLGSKRTLLPKLSALVRATDTKTVCDLFSGTARVGSCLKGQGYSVWANDITKYGHVLAQCFVEADTSLTRPAQTIIADLNRLPGRAGYFTDTFCVKSRFFHPKNGERIDAMREEIVRLSLDPLLEAVVLTSLMLAADRVDSTCGIQMAYLKQYAARAHNDIQLVLPALAQPVPGCRATQQDALETAAAADLVYLDPPYNQHSYLGNYHIWESLCLWDKPEVYGVACKRVDVKERKSAFNFKPQAVAALQRVVDAAKCRLLVVSFSDEGFIDVPTMLKILSGKGKVSVVEVDYKRYVGATIGVHSPSGEKVGTPTHLRCTEYLFVVEIDTTVRWAETGLTRMETV